MQLPTFIALAQVRPNIKARFTHYEVQEMYRRLLWRSAAQVLGHMHGVRSSSDQVTSTLTSHFADSKNIQFTIRILSRPTLSIAVTETVVKAQRSLRWEIEMIEVESEVTGIKPSSFST